MVEGIVVPPDLLDYCIGIRRHLHQNPEPSFQEEKTARYIMEQLTSLGLIGQQVARTGVYTIIDGGKPGPVIALRADIDALLLQEENEVAYASQVPGVMHACGHDGHTAILMGMANLLQQYRHLIVGKVILFFQPAEESPPGGAPEIITSGILDGVDAILALHVAMDLPTGSIGLRQGPMMASVDRFQVEIKGRGGHASKPHECIDPILISGQLINALQTIISRKVDPVESAVLSVCTIHGGSSFNIIPEKVTLSGTVRTLSEKVRLQVEKKFSSIAFNIAQAYGGQIEINYEKGYPVLVSHPKLLNTIKKAASDCLGQEAVQEIKPRLGGEDFAYYCQVAPSAYFFIGARNKEKEITYPEHNPRFNFDEDAMEVGLKVFVKTLERLWGNGDS